MDYCKSNTDWIEKARSNTYNVQTLMNGLKSQAFKKYNGDCKTYTKDQIRAFERNILT
jgi:hypothetical protein